MWYMHSTRHRGLTVYSVPCLVLATIASVTDQLKTCLVLPLCMFLHLQLPGACSPLVPGLFQTKKSSCCDQTLWRLVFSQTIESQNHDTVSLGIFSAYKPVLNSVIQYVSQSKQRVGSYTNIVRPPRAHSLSAPSAQPLRPERADSPPRACSRSAPSAQPLCQCPEIDSGGGGEPLFHCSR